MHGDLSWRACIGTIVAWGARLIRAHGPPGIRGARSHGDQACIGGKLTLSAALFQEIVGMVMAAVQMGMAVSVGGIREGQEADQRRNRCQHFVRRIRVGRPDQQVGWQTRLVGWFRLSRARGRV